MKVKEWLAYKIYMKEYINKIQNEIKGSVIADPRIIADSKTGNINLKYNPMNPPEHYYLVTRSEPIQEESVSFTPKQN